MKRKIPFFSDLYEKYRKKFYEKFNRELDYGLISRAHEKYTNSIIKTPAKFLHFEKNDNPKISVIIPVFNQFELTMKCLESILQSTKAKNYEIILIDDHSTDETRKIEKYVKNIKVIRNEKNAGFLKNCNSGAKAAKGEYLYLLNNDTQLLENAMEKLAEILDKVKDCGAAGSKLIFPDGKLQGAGSIIKKDGSTASIGIFNNPLSPEFNELKEVNYCCGASLMVKKALWDSLGGFDTLFSPGYYEETDLCLRIKEIGCKTIYQPESEVIHFCGCSFKESTERLIKQNRKKFLKKWRGRLKNLK